jgi:hypothetical protein
MYVPKWHSRMSIGCGNFKKDATIFKKELFDECNHTFVETFLLIVVTYCSYPNPIPRDRHPHLATACYTAQSRHVLAQWR